MDFNIESKQMTKNRKRKLKKQKIKFILAILLPIILLISFSILYVYIKNNSKEINEKPLKIIDEKKLSVFDEDSNDRPIAVMIDNNIGKNLHAGLQDSYLNYEIIVEGGLTRIMALYKDKDIEQIGPVRSSRHYFLDYALESDAIYAHYGYSTYAGNDIKSLGVNNIDGMSTNNCYLRDSKYPAPHNVFTSINRLKEAAKDKGYSRKSNNWKLLKYSVDEINLFGSENEENSNIKESKNVLIYYSGYQSRSYIYDERNRYYLRKMNGIEHRDRNTNEQLHYKNIIIQKVNNKTIDSEGRQDLDTVGSGTGYFITNGYSKEIKWTKLERNGKTTYRYLDDSEIVLNDGNTFIQIVPINCKIVIE